jgi:hypothetical protein
MQHPGLPTRRSPPRPSAATAQASSGLALAASTHMTACSFVALTRQTRLHLQQAPVVADCHLGLVAVEVVGSQVPNGLHAAGIQCQNLSRPRWAQHGVPWHQDAGSWHERDAAVWRARCACTLRIVPLTHTC